MTAFTGINRRVLSRTIGAGATQDYVSTYTSGYKLDAVDGPGTDDEDYVFDNFGRMTGITRDGENLTMTFDTTDRLMSVTKDGQTTTYEYDAEGRRVEAVQGTVERRFITGPTLDAGLDSPHLVSDGIGNVLAGYVHVGHRPVVRFQVDASGSPIEPVFYLEDAMGSIVCLANQAGTSIGRFEYDGFGKQRGTTRHDTQIAFGVAGDFRYQGQWLEAASRLYHVRLREYDPVAGRFATRDGFQGDADYPETFHPYNFANGNPHGYSDPSGLFTLIELNFSTAIQFSMRNMQAGAAHFGRAYAKNKIQEAVYGRLVESLQWLMPKDFSKVFDTFGAKMAGVEFGKAVTYAMCKSEFLEDETWRDPYITADGVPKDDGFSCEDRSSIQGNRYPNPDFVLSSHSPSSRHHAYVVGDAKLQGTTLRWYFKKKGGTSQWRAITNYARKHTYSKVALFITFTRGNKKQFGAMVQQMKKDSSAKGLIIVVIPLTNIKL